MNGPNRPEVREAGVRDISMGPGVVMVSPVNLYGCAPGHGCFVGPFVEIQKGVSVGARTKIQSHSFGCELVTIGRDITQPGVYAGNLVRKLRDRP